MATPSYDEVRYNLQQIDPYKFERLVGVIWGLSGYKIDVKNKSRDRAIDVEAISPNESNKTLIQAKRYSNGKKVDSGEVRKYATLYQQESNVDSVIIVTSSTFTDPAKQLAKDLDVQIINGDEVAKTVYDNYDTFKNFFTETTKKHSSSERSTTETVKKQNSNQRKSLKKTSRENVRNRRNYLSKKAVKKKIKNKTNNGQLGEISIRSEYLSGEDSNSYYPDWCAITLNYSSKLFGGYKIKITPPKGEIEEFEEIRNISGVTKAGIATYDHRPYVKIKKESLSDVETEFKVIKTLLNIMGSNISKVYEVNKY